MICTGRHFEPASSLHSSRGMIHAYDENHVKGPELTKQTQHTVVAIPQICM